MDFSALTGSIAAHQLVLERLLARLLDADALKSLRDECLGVEDALYRETPGGQFSHDALQRMLATVEALFAGAAAAQR